MLCACAACSAPCPSGTRKRGTDDQTSPRSLMAFGARRNSSIHRDRRRGRRGARGRESGNLSQAPADRRVELRDARPVGGRNGGLPGPRHVCHFRGKPLRIQCDAQVLQGPGGRQTDHPRRDENPDQGSPRGSGEGLLRPVRLRPDHPHRRWRQAGGQPHGDLLSQQRVRAGTPRCPGQVEVSRELSHEPLHTGLGVGRRERLGVQHLRGLLLQPGGCARRGVHRQGVRDQALPRPVQPAERDEDAEGVGA